MSAPISIRRELLNARVYFIPAGETVDAVTVAEATWPDNNPITNWTAYQLHDTEEVTLEREFEQETFKIPKATGGYFDDDDPTLKKVTLVGVTAKTSSIIKQLEYGLAAQPAVGVAQAPWTENEDFVEGVSLIELQNKAGVITERIQIWSRLRVNDPGKIGPQTKKITYSLEKRDSTANSYVLVA